MRVSELISKLEDMDQSLEVMYILDTKRGEYYAGKLILDVGYIDEENQFFNLDQMDELSERYPDNPDFVNMPRRKILGMVHW